MNKAADKTFEGSIFATFESVKLASNFMEHANGTKLNGIELSVKKQSDYWAEKIAETKERRTAIKLEKLAKKLNQVSVDIDAPKKASFQKGKIILVKGFPADIKYTDLKKVFNKMAPVSYVTLKTNEAFVRFKDAVDETTLKKMKKLNKIKRCEFRRAEISLLEGQEEENYYADLTEAMKSRSKRIKANRAVLLRRKTHALQRKMKLKTDAQFRKLLPIKKIVQ